MFGYGIISGHRKLAIRAVSRACSSSALVETVFFGQGVCDLERAHFAWSAPLAAGLRNSTTPSIEDRSVTKGALTTARVLRKPKIMGSKAQAAKTSSPAPTAGRTNRLPMLRRGSGRGASGGRHGFALLLIMRLWRFLFAAAQPSNPMTPPPSSERSKVGDGRKGNRAAAARAVADSVAGGNVECGELSGEGSAVAGDGVRSGGKASGDIERRVAQNQVARDRQAGN